MKRLRKLFGRSATALVGLTGLLLCSTAQAQTYSEALQKALDHSYSLSIQSENVRQAEARTALARSVMRPQAFASAAGTYGVRSGGDQFETSNIRMGVNQRLFDFSNTRNRVAGRSQIEQAQSWHYQQDQDDRMILASQIYLDLIAVQEAIRLRQASVDILRRQKQGAELKFDIGDGTRTDVGFADARLAATEAGLRRERQRLIATEAQFRRIFGFVPETVTPINAQAFHLPQTLQASIDTALQASPRVKARVAEAEAAQAFLNASQTDFHPRLDARVGLNFDASDLGGRVPSRTTEAAEILLNLTIPITTGGQRASQKSLARSDVRIARLREAQAKEDVERAVRLAWNDVQASEDLLGLVDASVSAAALALEGALKERDAGFRSALDVLDAEQQLLNSQLGRVEAEATRLLAMIRLLVLIGQVDQLLSSDPTQ